MSSAFFAAIFFRGARRGEAWMAAARQPAAQSGWGGRRFPACLPPAR